MPSVPPDPPAPGSGAQDLIGYQIDLSPGDGSARVVLDIEARHLNRNDTLHGGIIAMMLDSAAGFAVSRQLSPHGDARVVTISLTTQFHAPARQGRAVATGRVMGGGRKIFYADADLMADNNVLLARASGVFKRVGEST